MNDFKQLVMLACLAASFFSCIVQGMEKSTSEEKIESTDDILALLRNFSDNAEQTQTNYLFAGDEATRRPKWDIVSDLVKQEKDTTKSEEVTRIRQANRRPKSSTKSKTSIRSLSTGLYAICENAKPKPHPKKKTNVQKKPLNTIQE